MCPRAEWRVGLEARNADVVHQHLVAQLVATGPGGEASLSVPRGCSGSFSAGQVHEVCWPNPMQMTGQVECKWVDSLCN